MAYWLVKSEPDTWSWDDHVKKGVQGWEGVRNFQAAGNMKKMKKGDRAFFYHTGGEKRIVGVLEVVKEYHPDPTDETGKFGMVDFKAGQAFKTPVSLADVKAEKRLQHLALIKQGRLSVQPVDDDAWKVLCGMGGTKA